MTLRPTSSAGHSPDQTSCQVSFETLAWVEFSAELATHTNLSQEMIYAWHGIQDTPASDSPYNQDARDALRAFTLYLSAASGWKMV